jgi:hypothetical protein
MATTADKEKLQQVNALLENVTDSLPPAWMVSRDKLAARNAAKLLRQHADEIDKVLGPLGPLCKACGENEVTSKDPAEFPYCQTCYYTGRAFEDRYAARLASMQQELGEGVALSIWHTGGGCFMLRVESDALWPGYYGLTGMPPSEAEVPEPGEPWGFVCYYADEDDCEGDIVASEQPLTDAEACALLRADWGRRGWGR